MTPAEHDRVFTEIVVAELAPVRPPFLTRVRARIEARIATEESSRPR
jgi:hypothetical protein